MGWEVLQKLTLKSPIITKLENNDGYDLKPSPTPEQHLRDLRSVFERLATHDIVFNPNKCLFGVKEMDFLGHHITPQGITPLPEKVQAVQDFPQPQSQRQLRRFVELVKFYHRFLPHAAELMQPLRSQTAPFPSYYI